MPASTVTDRFDDVPSAPGRVGAHRAENPRLNKSALVLWAAIATVVLVAVGTFATLVASGRIVLTPPAPVETVSPTEEVTYPVDTSYSVLVLNATPQAGLAADVSNLVIAAGWAPDTVDIGDAAQTDFETTTVFYPFADAENAARGLAAAIGGAAVSLSDVYQPLDDPDTADVDEGQFRQLVIVVGLDRAAPVDGEDPDAG